MFVCLPVCLSVRAGGRAGCVHVCLKDGGGIYAYIATLGVTASLFLGNKAEVGGSAADAGLP